MATRIHRAVHVNLAPAAHKQLVALRAEGRLVVMPLRLAKTPYGFTAGETIRGAMIGHDLLIRE